MTTDGPQTTSFAVSGTGQAAGPLLATSPPVVSLGGTAVGGHLSGSAVFSNIGSAPLTINSVQLPAAPFSASGVPAPGTQIAAGASITVNVNFDPTALGTFVDSIGMNTTGGNGTVGLSAIAGTPGALQITSESNDYGSVQVGTTATKTFTVTNTGGSDITITKSKPPSGGAFAATSSLQEGTTIAAGQTLTETVTFTPTWPGYAAGTWQITGDDSSGLHQVQFTGTGSVPGPASGNWSTNGSATFSGSTLSLTGTGTFLAGSSFFRTPLDSHHIIVTFDSTIGGGSGADGLTLTLADAARGATASSLGYRGGGLGFSGIPGVAVALDTYKSSVNPSANFTGITDGPTSGGPDLMHWLATANLAASLRSGTHHVKVELLNGTLTVTIDGTLVLTNAVTLGPNVLIGFTGGTGGLTDNHQVTNVVVSGDTAPAPQTATLSVTNAVAAPSGSPQLGTQMTFSGSCPSTFTTAALGNGGSASPTLTGAVPGSSCTVSEPAPAPGGGTWITTVSVNGGAPVTLTATAGQLTVPSFAMVAGQNTVAFTNTWVAPGAPATLSLSNAVTAPAGSSQASAQMVMSGSCPSAFTTAALGNGGTASPTLTGGVTGAMCTVSETAPAPGNGNWVTTASVNGGAPVTLTVSGGQLTLPSFALIAGTNTVAFTNTWTPPSTVIVPDPTAGGWQLNGTSAISGTQLVLTPASTSVAGSAFWPTALDPRNLTINFDASISGGTGADGMTLIFADVSKGAKPTSLGATGGGLGFSGIPGIAVALDTYKNSVNPSANFAGITDGPTSSGADLLHWLATANLSAPLQNQTHHITVTTSNGTLSVAVDGTQVLSQAVTLPASAYLGFGAGTGGLTNRHAVANLTVVPAGPPAPATLTITNAVKAPAGSPQASTTFAISGSCPSSFTTAPLGDGGNSSPTLTGAVFGSSCTLSEPVPRRRPARSGRWRRRSTAQPHRRSRSPPAPRRCRRSRWPRAPTRSRSPTPIRRRRPRWCQTRPRAAGSSTERPCSTRRRFS